MVTSPNLILAFNVPAQQLIAYASSVPALPLLSRGLYSVRIYLRAAAPNSINGTVPFDVSGYDGLRMGIWETSPGTDGNVLALTDQTGWTYNTENPDAPYYEGDFNTLTDQMRDFLDGASSRSAYLSVSLVRGAAITSVYDISRAEATNITIRNPTDPGSGMGIDMNGVIPRIPLPVLFVKGNQTLLADFNADGTAVVFSQP